MATVTAGFIPWTLPGALLLLASAALTFAVRIVRANKSPVDAEVPPVRIFTATDVRRYVDGRCADQSPKLRETLADTILWDDDAPVMGSDWRAYLDANWDRLVKRATKVASSERGAR